MQTIAPPHGDAARTLAAQHAYCSAQHANDPGGTMLVKSFGPVWAEAYARNVLFRLPAPAINTGSLVGAAWKPNP